MLENPYIAAEDKERLKRQFEGGGREAQALHGGFAVAQGLVYSDFSRDTHVIPAAEARDRVEDGWRIYGYDAGWNDPRVLLEVGKTSYEQLVVLDEFHNQQTNVEDAIRWLKTNDKPSGPIFCDHEPSEIHRLRQAGYRAQNAEKSLDAGIAEVRKRLESDGNTPVSTGTERPEVPSVWDGGTEVYRPGLLVSGGCEHLVREFLGYKEEQVGKSSATDHCLDALRYCVMGAGKALARTTKERTRDRTF